MEFLSKVKIKLLNSEAKIPAKATPNSSGFDLFSTEELIIEKHKFKLISTGISIEMERGVEAQVRSRSGLAIKHGIAVLNSPGTIDCDYRGEVKVVLINHSDCDFTIEKGMRIAQMVFSKVVDADFQVVSELSDTQRGEGGFGSTGFK
ncbi:MAG: deoxyuridine 5'-triphosphate nucleotidohydrolase [Spirochaetes bacterium GWD1_27_9]|nr:MAG: deoxyuridine 5'-triphosphate nucleotidohydrolase [Spirochaetes bacterium GWB1_27_13]OHD20231.1 MAG: deoxyuridine 5'-triphosphate nucleotidohydrolase [Spirochaetes bacterium GWC1_27_15]OHD42582.1 MAG: deoxyuridine 5'-triphosphate nucleotidohydrolase [Spirochaetes bacterium GWD1_27_9]